MSQNFHFTLVRCELMKSHANLNFLINLRSSYIGQKSNSSPNHGIPTNSPIYITDFTYTIAQLMPALAI